MQTDHMVTQLDSGALIAMRILIAVFLALFTILSVVFAVALTAFLACWLVSRKMLVFALTRAETQAAFATLLGGVPL